MSRKIREDHKEYRKKVGESLDKEIKKLIKTGKLYRQRGKGKKPIAINIKKVDLPSFRFGKNNSGAGRGEGKPGDIIGKADPQPGDGKSGEPGEDHKDGQMVGVDPNNFMDYLGNLLKLPTMKPKKSSIFEDDVIKYNSINKVGLRSLVHKRRTLKQILLRSIQDPNFDPTNPVLIPEKDDFRFRTWKVTKKPSSKAVIFFMRDWSASMDEEKCELVSNICWWMDTWIRRSYERIDTIYVGHDTQAEIVDNDKFYHYRYGGGTKISSAFNLVEEQTRIAYPPDEWNIYVYYFSDGENWGEDNDRCIKPLRILSDIANVVGICQVKGTAFAEFLDFVLRALPELISEKTLRGFNIHEEDQISDVIRHFLYEPERVKSGKEPKYD